MLIYHKYLSLFRESLWSLATALFAALLVLTSSAVQTFPSAAQSAGSCWSEPELLFETTGRASGGRVLVDDSGTVHVLFEYGEPGYEELGSHQSIYYTQRNAAGWTTPTDVLVSPGDAGARRIFAAITSDGYIHLVWSGGNTIFYSSAPTSFAYSPRHWRAPVSLDMGASLLEPMIVSGPHDVLYVSWTRANSGLWMTRSDDGGRSWRTPNIVFDWPRSDGLPRYSNLAVDATGRLHLVFTHELQARSKGVDPMYIYYLRSQDEGISWTVPFLLVDSPDFGQVSVTAADADIVHVAWNGRAGRQGRYHRWSEDGGETWSSVQEIVAPFPKHPLGRGGLTGVPAMAVDAAGNVHLLSATDGADFYTFWDGSRWAEPIVISIGISGEGLTGRYEGMMEAPEMVLDARGVLHAVIQDGGERIWYTNCQLAGYDDGLPSHHPADSTVTPQATASPASTPQQPPEQPFMEARPRPSYSEAPSISAQRSVLVPLFISVLAVMLTVVVLVIASLARRRQ